MECRSCSRRGTCLPACRMWKNDTTTQETTAAAVTEAVTTEQVATADAQIATGSDLASASDVVEDWMVPIPAENVADGEYDIEVDSSSSMFNITACKLTVADGKMTAVMTMGGKGYRYLYMGTSKEAVAADESEYIPYVEDTDGAHTFTVPVDALDEGVACAAFSNKKKNGMSGRWCSVPIHFRLMP